MENVLANNLFWLVPVFAWYISKNFTPIWRSAFRGASFGAIVSPASLALYEFFFVSPITAVFGVFGLVMISIHNWVGYEIATTFGLVPSYSIIGENEARIINLINGIFWAILYGSVFYFRRKLRARIGKQI